MRRTESSPRYSVTWIPAEVVERKCASLGMSLGDGSSYWDWISPEDEMRTAHSHTFDSAVKVAQQRLPEDVFGEVRIACEELAPEQDDLGNVFRRKHWEETAVWHISDVADAISEDEPDYSPA